MFKSTTAEQAEQLLHNANLQEFLTFLKQERGFADATIVKRERSLKPFFSLPGRTRRATGHHSVIRLLSRPRAWVHPHSGRYQQAEKCRIGAGAKPVGRGELLTSAKDLINLLIAVDVRGIASVAMGEKSAGRNLGVRFGGAMPDGEASYDA